MSRWKQKENPVKRWIAPDLFRKQPGMKEYVKADEIKLIRSGNQFFETLEEIIQESKDTLHLQTYIFETDSTGKRIVKALIDAALRKVNVFVLLDAFGSSSFSTPAKKELEKAGVHFRFFSPFLSSENIFFGRRMHHKLVVADNRIALLGGINIAEKYHKDTKDLHWLDFAVRVKGKPCEYLELVGNLYYFKRGSKRLRLLEKEKKTENKGPDLIRFRRNDWLRGKNEIHKSYTEALLKAEKSAILIASYFIPGRSFRKLLADAAKRGVCIQLILAGKSDVGSVRLAENYLYDFYLKNNIQLYQWNDSVLHGKAMITDGKWATIGSYNLNYLSHYISIELNADIKNSNFSTEFADQLSLIISSKCEKIELKKNGNTLFRKIQMRLAFVLYKILRNWVMLSKKYRKSFKNL